MAVPDTNTFSLQDVVDEIPTADSLQSCFDDSDQSLFDDNYRGSEDRLTNFRNYGGISDWNVLGRTIDDTVDLTGDDPFPRSFIWKTDGTKFFFIGSDEDLSEYSPTTAWDIGTLGSSDASWTFSFDNTVTSMRISSNGLYIFILGYEQYSLSRYAFNAGAWDLSNGASSGINSSPISETTEPTGLDIKPDGTKVYIVSSNSRIYQYSMSSYLPGTLSYDSKFVNLSSMDNALRGITFKPDGTRAYVTGNENSRIYQLYLSTPWDISTATYGGSFLSVETGQGFRDIGWKDDGSVLYLIGDQSGLITQYT